MVILAKLHKSSTWELFVVHYNFGRLVIYECKMPFLWSSMNTFLAIMAHIYTFHYAFRLLKISTDAFHCSKLSMNTFQCLFFTFNKDLWTYKLLGTINDVAFLSKIDEGFLMTSPYVVQKLFVDFRPVHTKLSHSALSSRAHLGAEFPALWLQLQLCLYGSHGAEFPALAPAPRLWLLESRFIT